MNRNDQNIEWLKITYPFGTIYADHENDGKAPATTMKYGATLLMRICSILLPVGADGMLFPKNFRGNPMISPFSPLWGPRWG
jgi:hypothetical protein